MFLLISYCLLNQFLIYWFGNDGHHVPICLLKKATWFQKAMRVCLENLAILPNFIPSPHHSAHFPLVFIVFFRSQRLSSSIYRQHSYIVSLKIIQDASILYFLFSSVYRTFGHQVLHWSVSITLRMLGGLCFRHNCTVNIFRLIFYSVLFFFCFRDSF